MSPADHRPLLNCGVLDILEGLLAPSQHQTESKATLSSITTTTLTVEEAAAAQAREIALDYVQGIALLACTASVQVASSNSNSSGGLSTSRTLLHRQSSHDDTETLPLA